MNKFQKPNSDVRVQTAKETIIEDYLVPIGKFGMKAGVGAARITGLVAAIPTTWRSYKEYTNEIEGAIVASGVITAMGLAVSIPFQAASETDFLLPTFGVLAATNAASGFYELGRGFKKKYESRLEKKLNE